jgi:hypothetical protein
MKSARWLNLRSFIASRLSVLGAEKHEAEFNRDSRTWTRQMAQDFLAREQYEKGPALAMVGMLSALWSQVEADIAKGSPDFHRLLTAAKAGMIPSALPAMAGPGGYSIDQLASLMGPSLYQMPDFSLFQNELKGYNEVVRWPLYSTKSYPTTGTAQLTFYDQSEGLATNGRADTNMQAAGQLPGNQMHVAHSLRIFPIAPKASFSATSVVSAFAAAELLDVLTNLCWAEITVSDKLYLIAAPLTLLPAGQGPGTFHNTSGINTANSFSWANNGHPSNEAIYRLNPPLGILPTRTFLVTNNWKGTPPTVTNAIRFNNNLDGWRLRSVQ